MCYKLDYVLIFFGEVGVKLSYGGLLKMFFRFEVLWVNYLECEWIVKEVWVSRFGGIIFEKIFYMVGRLVF